MSIFRQSALSVPSFWLVGSVRLRLRPAVRFVAQPVTNTSPVHWKSATWPFMDEGLQKALSTWQSVWTSKFCANSDKKMHNQAPLRYVVASLFSRCPIGSDIDAKRTNGSHLGACRMRQSRCDAALGKFRTRVSRRSSGVRSHRCSKRRIPACGRGNHSLRLRPIHRRLRSERQPCGWGLPGAKYRDHCR